MPNQRREDKRIVGCWITAAMLSQIDALARDQDRDRSYIMRKAIAEYLARISADGNAAFCAQGVPRQERAGTTT